MLMPYSQPSI